MCKVRISHHLSDSPLATYYSYTSLLLRLSRSGALFILIFQGSQLCGDPSLLFRWRCRFLLFLLLFLLT